MIRWKPVRLPGSQLIDRPIEALLPARFASHHAAYRDRFMSETKSRPMGGIAALFARHRNGREFPVDIMLSPMRLNGPPLVLCVVRDITERRAAEEILREQTAEMRRLHAEMKELASRDSLTGLLNRRAFLDLAGRLLQTAHRRQERVAVLMIDLDHFKQINDHFGHAEGDAVLKRAAAALRDSARQEDVVARFGGEEFTVAFQGSDDPESVTPAERFRATISTITPDHPRVTASIGVASVLPTTQAADTQCELGELLKRADVALYEAKRAGRDRVVLAPSGDRNTQPRCGTGGRNRK